MNQSNIYTSENNPLLNVSAIFSKGKFTQANIEGANQDSLNDSDKKIKKQHPSQQAREFCNLI